MQLLAKNREDRPASAQEVALRLQPLASAHVDRKATTRQKPTPTLSEPAALTLPAVAAEDSKSTKSAPARRSILPIAILGLAILALATVLVIAGIILYWQTPHGTVRLESDDPNVEITFDKNGPTIKGIDKKPITLKSGEHGILVQRGNFSFETDKILIEKGKTVTLKVELIKGKMQLVHDGKVIGGKDLPIAPPQNKSTDPDRTATEALIRIDGSGH
jgi:hypothetical protein